MRAQIVITAVGSTGYVNQQPGLSNDFIDFFSGNYPMGGPSINNVSLPSGTVTSDYSSFSFAGGVAGGNSDTNNFSTITTPQGQSFLTGVLRASSGSDLPAFSSTIAFAVEPTGDQNVDYNDFYIYVMYSNTNGTDNDGEIWVAPRSSVQDGGPYGEGTRTVVTSLDDNANSNGLADVNPIFTWVRLAQRLPVRIKIDQVPEGVTIAAGQTCTIVLDRPRKP